MTSVARCRVPSLVILWCLAAAGAAQAQSNARIDKVFAEFDRAGSPGCAVGAVQDGTLVYAKGYGSANLDYDVPITPRSVFYLASASKQFTAASVVLAARQGALSLDDDVRKWIPELPDYGQTITIRHLLHHTSGLRDYFTLLTLAGVPYKNVFTGDELIALIARQKGLNFTPGTEHLYSNSGYLLLAEIVERATKQRLSEFAEQHIFRPLGMRDTHFHDDAGKVVPRRVIGYARNGSGFRVEHYFNFDKVGDGGLYSTIEDLAKWDKVFYSSTFGGEEFATQMLERGVLANGESIPYALGLRHGTYRGAATVEHGGSLAGFRTMIMRFPEQKFTTILLCNVNTANVPALVRRVADVYIPDRTKPGEAKWAAQPPAPPATRVNGGENAPLADFSGAYYSEELQVTYRIALERGVLMLRRPPMTNVMLFVVERDVFRIGPAGALLRFQRDASGRVTGFKLDADRVRGIIFLRRQ